MVGAASAQSAVVVAGRDVCRRRLALPQLPAPERARAAADRRDRRAVGAVEVDDHARERRPALRQDDDARAAAAALGRDIRPLGAVAADCDQRRGAGTRLCRDRASNRHPAGDAAEQRGREVGHLGGQPRSGRALAGPSDCQCPSSGSCRAGAPAAAARCAEPPGPALHRRRRALAAGAACHSTAGQPAAGCLAAAAPAPAYAAARPPGATRPGPCRAARWSVAGSAPTRSTPPAQATSAADPAEKPCLHGRLLDGSSRDGRPSRPMMACTRPPLPQRYRSMLLDQRGGAKPNMRLQVRLRCAESAKPASCAAAVHDWPFIAAPTAVSTRAHSR